MLFLFIYNNKTFIYQLYYYIVKMTENTIYFVAKVWKTALTSKIITLPKTLPIKAGDTYQFSINITKLNKDNKTRGDLNE